MSITCSFFYEIKNFFHLWIFQEENYNFFKTWNVPRGELQIFFDVKGNGATYKKINIKNTN